MIEVNAIELGAEIANNEIIIDASLDYRGPQGPQGPIGPPGPKGNDGTVAFDKLTEEQKQSLKGEKGEQGIPGTQGPQGSQGLKGEDGYTPQKEIDYFTQEDIEELDKKKIKKYITLLDMCEVAPINFVVGDKYYNIRDKLIYTAIDSLSWSDFSEEPYQNVFYINENNQKIYYFKNNNMQPIGSTPDEVMSDESTNSVQNKVIKEYIDKVNLEYQPLKYNLVVDGPAVKTGRKINNKDEWVKYVTYKDTLTAGMNKTAINNLPAGANMHYSQAVIKPVSGSGVIVQQGYYSSSTDFFNSHGYTNGNVQLAIGSGSAAIWLNNRLKCYMMLYYTVDEVQNG